MSQVKSITLYILPCSSFDVTNERHFEFSKNFISYNISKNQQNWMRRVTYVPLLDIKKIKKIGKGKILTEMKTMAAFSRENS